MASPLTGLRFLAAGIGPVVDAAVELLELLGAEVVRFGDLAGPVHAARAAQIDAAGAIDATGRFEDPPFPVVRVDGRFDPDAAWAASGAAALTGPPDGRPHTAPGRLVERLTGAGAVVQLLAACRARVLDLEPLALLGERAAITGFTRQGHRSVGGACDVLAAADGWVACSLARPEDLASLPALLDGEADATDWGAVRAAVARRTRAQLVERAALLGVPLGAWPGPDGVEVPGPFRLDGAVPRRRMTPGDASGVLGDAPERPLVVDLSSLWAGPLAGSLLAAAGARVVKVEGARRPDGARRGPADFFTLLNAGKESVALDFTTDDDRALLRTLLEAADVVIDGSRPRVMASLGIDPQQVVASGRTTWISITGHGRSGDAALRVAFGDDAGFEAGCTVGDPPMFVADAVADPITGIYGAAVGLAALVGRRGNLVDLPLSTAAAYARGAGGPRGAPCPDGVEVAPPRARPVVGAAPRFGADTDAVRAELGYGRRP